MNMTRPKWHSAGWWAAVGGIAAVIGVVVAVAAYLDPTGPTDGSPSRDDSPLSAASKTSTSATTTSSRPLTSSSRTRTSAVDEPGFGGAGPTRYYLADLPYVEVEIQGRAGGCTGGCTAFTTGSAKVGATTYPQSFITRMDGDGNPSVSTWNSLRSCDSFEANIGLTNDSDSTTTTFTISKDGGAPEVLAEVVTGDVMNVVVDLNGVNRFVLAAYVSGGRTERATAVWGDAVLTCAAGSLD